MSQDWMNWTTDQVAEWLTSIGLPHISSSIYSLRITGEHLPKIDDNFLKVYLKVNSPAERILFLQFLKLLPNMTAPQNHSSAPSTPNSEEIPTKKRPPPKPNSILDAQILINSPENMHSGWIIKQGGRIRTWKRRYMVLHQGCLYYFENEKSSKQKGSLALPGYILSESNEVKEFPNCMKLAHKNPSKRVYLICTSSQREKDKWMECIQDELDLYKEENLLGQAIYGDGSELDAVQSAQMNERLSDGDNDEDDVSTVPNIPSRFATSKEKFPENSPRLPPSKSMISKTDRPHIFSPEPIPHSNTMKPVNSNDTLNAPIATVDSSPASFQQQMSPLSPRSPISSCPSSPTSQNPPSMPPQQPDMSEDHYLIISANNQPINSQSSTLPNGLAHRDLPVIPENNNPPSRPLPTPPSEPQGKNFPPSLESTIGKRHSTPGISPTQSNCPDSRQSLPSLPSLPPNVFTQLLPPKKPDGQSYEDVEAMDDFEQLGANFGKTLQGVKSPKTSIDSTDDAAGIYISPNMEVLPEACIQSKFTRIKAEEVLASINHDGMYLIRDSSEETINMVLTVWCKDRCKHYKVFKHEKGYCLHRGTYFASLEELIRQYHVTYLPRSSFTLKTPYNIQSSKPRFS